MVYYQFVPESETVNLHFYQQILIQIHKRVRRSRRELWNAYSWLLHHDNAPAHKAINVSQLLVKKKQLLTTLPILQI